MKNKKLIFGISLIMISIVIFLFILNFLFSSFLSNWFLEVIDQLLKIFTYTFVQKALIAGILIGLMGAIIGVFTLLKGLVFFGEAVAHASFAGAGFSLLLGLTNPLGMIFIFGISSAIGIQYINERKLMRSEIILGIFFTATMALAIIFINIASAGYWAIVDIQSLIFGNILIISTESFIIMIIVCFFVLLILIVFKKELYAITFNSEIAEISGINVRLINYIFLILIALVIAVSLKAIGAILVFAMIVTPSAAAFQYTFKINRMILISVLFSILSTFLGILTSFFFNLASGATIVIIATIIFGISFIISPKRRKTTNFPDECKFCKNFLTKKEREICQDATCKIKIDHLHAVNKVKLLKEKKE